MQWVDRHSGGRSNLCWVESMEWACIAGIRSRPGRLPVAHCFNGGRRIPQRDGTPHGGTTELPEDVQCRRVTQLTIFERRPWQMPIGPAW